MALLSNCHLKTNLCHDRTSYFQINFQMEAISEKSFVKYSELIQGNAEKEDEIFLTSSQKSHDKLNVEKLDLEGIENNTNVKIKRSQKNFGLKTLVGLSLVFLMIVTGLITGLLILNLKIQNLEQKLESNEQFADGLMNAENMTQAEMGNFIIQNKNQINKKLAFKHFQKVLKDKELIFTAIKDGDFEKVKLILDLGVSVNTLHPDIFRETPLHWASAYGHFEIAKLLLDNGADVNARAHGNCIPLHYAAKNGYAKIAELLLQNGADVNAKTFESEYTPLFYAARYGHPEVVQVLLKHGARKDLRNWRHRSPLEIAAEFMEGNYKQVIALLKND